MPPEFVHKKHGGGIMLLSYPGGNSNGSIRYATGSLGWNILYNAFDTGSVKLETYPSLSSADSVEYLVKQLDAPRSDKNNPIGDPRKSTNSLTMNMKMRNIYSFNNFRSKISSNESYLEQT